MQRELQGRLLGETLSPKQFALLYNAQLDKNSTILFQKDADRKDFIDSKDLVRLMDEAKEISRRRRVLSGKWTEEESHKLIEEEHRKEAQRLQESRREHDQELRARRETEAFMNALNNDEAGKKMRLEKEYYFDEGLGESLKDHVDDLKSRFPELEVQVRRDREGYPIIKTSFSPVYKFDIEKTLQFDPDVAMKNIKESVEDIQASVYGVKSISNLNREELEKKISNAMNTINEPQYAYDASTQAVLEGLWKERLNGKYQHDR